MTAALEVERKSFYEAMTRRRMNSSYSGNNLGTGASSQAETETGSVKERPWEVVCWKKKRRHSPVEGYMHMTGPSKEGHPRQRHSPPLKRTSSGVVEVCGKCRRPGHVMKECRREEVCRRCEWWGHREARCPISPSEIGLIVLQGVKLAWKKNSKKETGVKDTANTLNGVGNRRDEFGKHKETTSPEVGRQHFSLAVDEDMMAEKEKLSLCSIALVTKIRGIFNHKKVMEEVATIHEPGLEWKAEEYDDQSYLLYCPSTTITQRLESMGEIDFPAFSATFEP
ncbi:hypothetical protein J5N97_022464 [Dioscorea zingiberensis]|uniref:CCHC-type domain-containing protein n=1 Tax=Dioscorea zingiberensis TaxID=325984 RepID=A0A9D5HAV1_9LILI|nr:hypothetical protein J5N97_022464 [Dioscorea zingiberensis]